MSALSRKLSLVLRIAVSVGLFALMLSRLDAENMLRFVRRARLDLVAVTLIAVLVDRALMAYRWMTLVEALDVRASRVKLFKIFFVSTFFGSFLPSGVGGEAVRAVSFSRLTSRGVESVTSVVLDRIFGFFSMLLTGLLSLSIFYRLYPHPALFWTVLLAFLALGLAISLSLSRRVHRFFLGRASGGTSRLSAWSARAVDAMARYRDEPGTLALVLLMSVAVQLLRVLQAYLLSESMSLGMGFIYFLCFVPPLLVVTMLPISVGGWGTANIAYVALFSSVGMDRDGAFVLSVLILALGVVGNLPGGLIYAWEGFSSARSGERAAEGAPET